jgi:hypothetical protein
VTSSSGALPIQRSSRDSDQLRQRLEDWLARQVGVPVTVADLAGTAANGMSSDTVLFHAAWTADGTAYDEALGARIAPDASDVPVFPT